MENIFQKNTIKPLLGNEAIVLGALESGVGFIATYPGTPASEIGNMFYKIKDTYRIYMEYSVNEKIALETAAAAAFSGVKALVAMKNFGANVAMDALIPIAHCKPRAGLVIIIADDPSCHSSAQSEQDSRVFIDNLNLITLEPSDPAEAKEFTKIAFMLSEKFSKPVIIRITTRVAHQTSAVKIGKIPDAKVKGKFIKDPERFNIAADTVLSQKRELLLMKKPMEKYIYKTKLNPITRGRLFRGYKQYGIIASGAAYLYVLEAMQKLDVSLPILKIDTYYPLPLKDIHRFLKNKDKVFVAEEIIGLIEEKIKAETGAYNRTIEFYGKNIMEPIGELDAERVTDGLAKMLKVAYKKPKDKKLSLTKRTPRFCNGCPYWSIFSALKNVINSLDTASGDIDPKDIVFTGDIGCHMIGYFPPFELQDTSLCMTASVSLAHGISKATDQKVIAMMGDSALLHSGIPGLLNIVNNESNPLVIIFENGITGMTGRQPHPGTPLEFKKHDGKSEINIEEFFQVIGMKHVIVDPVKQIKKLEKEIKKSLTAKKATAIICRRPCVYIGQLEKGI